MKNLSSLPLWQGKVFRGHTGYRNAGLTAFDIVKFECKELGNYRDFKHLNSNMLNELKKYPADDIIWVAKTYQTAKQYGEASLVFITGIQRIIATDGDNGYLILKMKAK